MPKKQPHPRSVAGFSARNNLSRTTTYKEIKAGRLKASKVGERTIIFEEDEEAWKRSLSNVLLPNRNKKRA